jgi:hypothetical protein
MRRTCTHHSILALGLTALVGCYDPGADADDPTDADSSGTTDPTDPTDATDPTNPSSTTQTPSTTDPTTDDSDSESSGEPDPTDASESSDAESSDDGGDSTGEPDAPTVVETEPADGATGVRNDAAIVVRFSAAMDQAATQAAYQSASIPAADVTFAWNDAGDELTITPLEPLEYAVGGDPTLLAAMAYDFVITTTAETVEGVALENDVPVSFTTLRRLEQALERDTDLSGNVGEFQGPLGTTFFGDRSTNEAVRFAVTFDLTALAADVAEVEAAMFNATWSGQSGNPWAGLGGGTEFQHVVFADLDEAFDAAAIGSAYELFGGIGDTDVSRDAAWALDVALADLAAHEDRLQLRARWLLDTDNDGVIDSVTIVPADLELHVTYLAP